MLTFNCAGSLVDEGALPITSYVKPDPAPEERLPREPGRPQPVLPERVPPDSAPQLRPDPTDPAPGRRHRTFRSSIRPTNQSFRSSGRAGRAITESSVQVGFDVIRVVTDPCQMDGWLAS